MTRIMTHLFRSIQLVSKLTLLPVSSSAPVSSWPKVNYFNGASMRSSPFRGWKGVASSHGHGFNTGSPRGSEIIGTSGFPRSYPTRWLWNSRVILWEWLIETLWDTHSPAWRDNTRALLSQHPINHVSPQVTSSVPATVHPSRKHWLLNSSWSWDVENVVGLWA